MNTCKIISSICLLAVPIAVEGQVVINGNFEINTAGSCDYNLPNATFNAEISNMFAFGAGNEIDIMSACSPYCPSAQSGNWYISLANSSGTAADQLSLTLSAPLVTGITYTLSFWDHGENSTSYPPTPLQVSVSTVNNATGTIIYTAVTPAVGIWKQHIFNFTAPVNGQYLVFSATSTQWTQLDNVILSSPLPVGLLSFTATLQDNNIVNLGWTTASEINNNYFTVERSADGKKFIELIKVKGCGNSSCLKSYEAPDVNALRGTSYYRLKQTDFNGHTEELKTVSIKNYLSGADELSIYPNPVQDNAVIALNNLTPGAKTNLLITDANGKVFIQKEIIPCEGFSLPLSLNKLSAGIYFLQINSAGLLLREKFMKE